MLRFWTSVFRDLPTWDDIFGARIQTLVSTDTNIENAVREADLVIGSVLIPGKAAPKLMKRAYLKEMKPGSVIVDVAVDQGGCCETTKVTYHDDPIYEVDGIIHYCVGNMPGSCAENIHHRAHKCHTALPVLPLRSTGWKKRAGRIR